VSTATVTGPAAPTRASNVQRARDDKETVVGRVRVAAQQHAFFGFRRSKMTRAAMNTFTLPSFAAPEFRHMKMARATTSTMVVAAAAVVVTNLARGGEGGGRAYEEAVRLGLKGCPRDQTCMSWCSRCPGAQDCLP